MSWRHIVLSMRFAQSAYQDSLVLQALPGQQTPDGIPSFKLVLVGDGGTGQVFAATKIVMVKLGRSCQHGLCADADDLVSAGKTTFVKRHLTGEFEKKYERECIGCCICCSLNK